MYIDLFSIAGFLGVGSFLVVLLELIGVQLFWKIFYKIGIRIYSETTLLPRPTDKNIFEKVYKMDEGKFEIVSRNECLFTSHPHFLNFFRFHTPFPFKGTVVWTDKGASISARLPIGTSLFLLFWLVGWSAGSFQSSDVSFFLMGFLFVGIMVAISLPIEKRRMIQMIDELKSILNDK